MVFPDGSRARTASAAANGCVLDYGASFQPSKRPRLAAGGQALPENEPFSQHAQEPSLVERLLLEMSSTAAWKLSSDRSITQNESFLHEQLEHAVLLSGHGEMTAEMSRLPFAALAECASGTPQAARVESHVRHAMDVVSWLLVERQRDLRRQDTLMDAQRVLEKDVERRENQLKQAQTDIEGVKVQLAQQENMFHAREQALVAERKALQQDKRHLEVMCAKLQGQETAFKAQLRRKDVEYERLKKSLQDAAQRSAKEQRGMTMGKVLNGLTERRQTAQRVVQSHENLMTKRLLENLERKRDELLFENEALAKNFESLQKLVESVSAQYKKAVSLFLAQRGEEGNTDETAELARVPIDDFTPAPLQLGVKTNVSAYIADTVHKLADKVHLFERAMHAELEYSMKHPSEDVVRVLKEKLAEAQAVITEQDRLVQASLIAPSASLESAKTSGKSAAVDRLDKENVHVNTGKQQQPQQRYTTQSAHRGGRRRPVEHAIFEQWEDELESELQNAKRMQRHIADERQFIQTQGERLDMDRLAFEVRNFEHFFGTAAACDGDIVMENIDCPTTPRTAKYLRSIGIFPSVVE